MRITDRLIENQNKVIRKEIRDKEDNQPEFQDEEEGYFMYTDRPYFGDLNSNRSVFDTTDTTSINTAPSVFDRTAIFHTKTENE